MPNPLLDAALAYAQRGWRVFPTHGIVGQRLCSCRLRGRCRSPGKHPVIPGGFKSASSDEQQIRSWWGKWPNANIGVATGAGLVVIDIDGIEGQQRLTELLVDHQLPETLISRTGRDACSAHLWFTSSSPVRSRARGGIDVRADGAFVIAPPSRHASGRVYSWHNSHPVAPLPKWLEDSVSTIGKQRELTSLQIKHPSHLLVASPTDIAGRALRALTTIDQLEAQRISNALSAISADNYEIWRNVGFALHDANWLGNFAAWSAWSATCPEKYAATDIAAVWASFGRKYDGPKVGLGTVFHLAKEAGWNPAKEVMSQENAPKIAPAPASTHPEVGARQNSDKLRQIPTNGAANGAVIEVFPHIPAHELIAFPDIDKWGKPKPTTANARVAIGNLGISCRYDQWHRRFLVADRRIEQWADSSSLTDEVVLMLRQIIRTEYGFDPGRQNTEDGTIQACLGASFDPVLSYLNALTWDAQPRLSTWLSTYLGAEQTPLTAAVGRLMLIAAVRRAREPGCEWQQMVVFEGPEGIGKTMALKMIAGGDDYYCGERIMDRNERVQQELAAGTWIYEVAELAGMRAAETEFVRTFISRTEDRARPAYGRFLRVQKRRCIFVGTTNETEYLRAWTGNRRFWPIRTSRIDLDALARDRDQLMAEAATAEATAEPLALPRGLWSDAREQQETRLEDDPWRDRIERMTRDKAEVAISDLLHGLGLRPEAINRSAQMRAASILQAGGWIRNILRRDGKVVRRYVRPDQCGDPPQGAGGGKS